MQNGGSALMGTGIGRGEDRALDAAQQAIASPLLDDVSIAGSTGVLVNITGGEDLTLGEVNQISEIVHDAAGDEAEIIFGAVHDPAMAGEVRVTVIATGFDRQHERGEGGRMAAGVLPFPEKRPRPSTPAVARPSQPSSRLAAQPPPVVKEGGEDVSEMEIPTFIRRQMD
jgi:cell division protein FtsZ